MHIEADNLLYGKYSSLLDTLRNGYPTLAATPLNANKSFITASVFWIANLMSLVKFNDFLLSLGHNYNDNWKKYLKWLRFFACCRHGGVDPDETGIICSYYYYSYNINISNHHFFIIVTDYKDFFNYYK